jgi:ATP-dependent Lhr-like helicase
MAPGNPLASFHPLLQRWFSARLGEPSAPQRLGWPLIAQGKDVLVSAPTGSGKTLAAFFSCLDELLRLALRGRLPDQMQVLYVSPLKALANDVQRNLLEPLKEIMALAEAEGFSPQPIRVQVRSGDTRASERAGMVKRPPHILITTPESLFLYLTAARSRETLRTVRVVVVDEIHALARDKRGAHLTLSLERLKALTSRPPQLIGLSATQRPLETIAAFLTGDRGKRCERVEVGHLRRWELRVEAPDQGLSSLATNEMWGQIYDRIATFARQSRSVLVFANTRRLAERVAHDLGQRLGQDQVAAHHGSMSREMRLQAEERLKRGELRVMVATSSLELGIDIGSIDLVCQLGSPRSISGALQRIGRSGHTLGGVARGVLFALTQDELVECTALVKAIRDGALDAIRPLEKPLDVLAQQIVAAVACEDWNEDELFSLCRRAYPYRHLTRGEFERVLRMLSESVATYRGFSRAPLHRDRVNHRLRARKGARLTALTNAGTIPDTFSYRVVAEPEERVVGMVDEEFATECIAGDVFLLGSTAWRIRKISQGVVRVEDARGQAPDVPFWRAEAPSRSEDLSEYVSSLRERLAGADAQHFLEEALGLSSSLASELVAYLRAGEAELRAIPSQRTVVAERFFDESGGTQLVIHAPFGGRMTRAWGLALRARFGDTFGVEPQAAATDDGLLISLAEGQHFPLEEIFELVTPENAEEMLIRGVMATPMLGTRFRWAATCALVLQRVSMGKHVPPYLQRMRSDDLLQALFPAYFSGETRGGTEVPEHPLVDEALRECLHGALDLEGLKRVLEDLRSGAIRARALELPGPSAFARQFLHAQAYAFLDNAPIEERRVRAVSMRRSLRPEDAAAFGALDADAIARVVTDAQPVIRDAEELHDALRQLVLMRDAEVQPDLLEELARTGRAARVSLSDRARFAVAAEELVTVKAALPRAMLIPALEPLQGEAPSSIEEASTRLVRARMEICGPVTSGELGEWIPLDPRDLDEALRQLEAEGGVVRGQFRPGAPGDGEAQPEWCDRRLLQRIHRLTVGRLRAEIQPLSAQDLMRFLFRWQHLEPGEALHGRGGLKKAVALLQGWEAPASTWEQALLRSRMKQWIPELLELACWSGELAWGRFTPRIAEERAGPRRGVVAPVEERVRRPWIPGRNASISFALREDLDLLLSASRLNADGGAMRGALSRAASDVLAALERRGASFFLDLVSASRRLPSEVEDALWELLTRGLVTADAVENLRVLQLPANRRRRGAERGGPGRWSLLHPGAQRTGEEVRERLARLFLERYGIVWRDLAMREPLAPSWRELLEVYRRMEARGQIRGGRFLAGFAGEQFALPEAVEMARSVRRGKLAGTRIVVAAVDPLNLTGVVTPGPRVPAIAGHAVVYLDGIPISKAEKAILGPEAGPQLHLAVGRPEPRAPAGEEDLARR